MTARTYGMVSPEHKKAMSGLEFVTGPCQRSVAAQHLRTDLGL